MRARPVMALETKTIYPSIVAAARSLGVNESSVRMSIARGVKCKGSSWAYVEYELVDDDDEEIVMDA
eukprot:g7015.t1